MRHDHSKGISTAPCGPLNLSMCTVSTATVLTFSPMFPREAYSLPSTEILKGGMAYKAESNAVMVYFRESSIRCLLLLQTVSIRPL